MKGNPRRGTAEALTADLEKLTEEELNRFLDDWNIPNWFGVTPASWLRSRGQVRAACADVAARLAALPAEARP